MTRPIVLPWLIWFCAIVSVLLGVVWLASCAAKPLPLCPPILGRAVVTGQFGSGYFMDEDDTENLRATLYGLRDGTCRLPPEEGAEI